MNAKLRAWTTTLAILAALSLLAACGTAGGGNGDDNGDDDGDGGPGGTQDVGFVVVDESDDPSGGNTVSAGGGFWRLDGTIPDDYADDVWADVVGTCTVYDLDSDDPFAGAPVPEGVDVSYLEAGDELTVTAGGASYLTAEREELTFGGETLISYGSDEVSGTLANDLALTVPGDEFPSVDDAAFPDVPDFELTAPSDPGATDSVDESTTFEWSDPTNSDDTVVEITLASSDASTFVSCVAPDTGTFELPSETVSELGGSFSGSITSALRQGTRVEAVGDANLILGVSRSESFVAF